MSDELNKGMAVGTCLPQAEDLPGLANRRMQKMSPLSISAYILHRSRFCTTDDKEIMSYHTNEDH
jgi:hypothetical protein